MTKYDAFEPIKSTITSEVEAQLVIANLKAAVEKMKKALSEEDEQTRALVVAIVSTQQLRDTNRTIDDRINALMAESEQLIESPDANTPEVLAQRQELKEETNKLLDTQMQMKPHFMEMEAAEIVIQTARPEARDRAEKVVEELFSKAPDIYPRQRGLN